MLFITDRTTADILLGNEKGTYNYTDLNRVEANVQELQQLMEEIGIHADISTVKTDWKPASQVPIFSATEWPTREQMNIYLNNVKAIKQAFPGAAHALPGTLDNMTVDTANAIEKNLEYIYNMIRNIKTAWLRCGNTVSGGYIR